MQFPSDHEHLLRFQTSFAFSGIAANIFTEIHDIHNKLSALCISFIWSRYFPLHITLFLIKFSIGQHGDIPLKYLICSLKFFKIFLKGTVNPKNQIKTMAQGSPAFPMAS